MRIVRLNFCLLATIVLVGSASAQSLEFLPNAEGHITSSSTGSQADVAGSSLTGGVNINSRVGANAFYAAGYTGTRAIAANIEAGHVWNGHESLTHVNTFISGPTTIAAIQGNAAATDRHATWVGQTIAGRTSANNAYQQGIAHGATLWSGAVASSWATSSDYSLGFQFGTFENVFTPYRTALIDGVAGQRADVVNSSYGFSNDSAGRNPITLGIDAIARESARTIVFSAGNSGSAPNTVGGPGTGYNTLSVAALQGTTGANPYNTVADFSSRGPNDAFVPTDASVFTTTGQTFANARVRVDIAAPGQSLNLAFYGGQTGGNVGGPNDGTAVNTYSQNVAGTSFAAPTVAGGVALFVDAAREQNLANGIDARVIKSVLLTTADKTAGWNNGQALSNGVIVTSQALDVAVGAGRMNLAAALPFATSASATRDVAGLTPGDQGIVTNLGWDLGNVNRLSQNDYTIGTNLEAGSTVTATLNWFSRRSITGVNVNSLLDSGLADLDLEIWKLEGGVFTDLVATSLTIHNNTEHLFFNLAESGQYGIRVSYFGDVYNFDGSTSETYGLAWNFSPVPEPGSILLVVTLIGLGGHRLRRRYRI